MDNLLVVLMIVQLIFIRNDSYIIDLMLQLREKVCDGRGGCHPFDCSQRC